jgi:phosphoglycolate phosphatase
MGSKDTLVVLDFDGFLINSYELLRRTFDSFGLDVGDESRFRNRRRFLKYVGGGREFLGNLVSYSLPRRKKFRAALTEQYMDAGRIYPDFPPLINEMIRKPRIHVGIVSRNFTLKPGSTMRTVLRNSGVDEHELDFVIPLPIGADKRDVLEAMRSHRYEMSLFGADEIGDFRAADETGYSAIMAGYGFDAASRLVKKGGVPPQIIFDSPEEVAAELRRQIDWRHEVR